MHVGSGKKHLGMGRLGEQRVKQAQKEDLREDVDLVTVAAGQLMYRSHRPRAIYWLDGWVSKGAGTYMSS